MPTVTTANKNRKHGGSKLDDSKKSSVEVTVLFEGEEAKANISIEEYTFSDIDGWVRSRFGIKAHDQLRYMDKLGAGECSFVFVTLETS
jgi:hypothetical protein